MDYNSQNPIQVIIPEKSASTEATYNTIPTYASYQPPVTNVYTDVQESTYISSPPQPVPMIPLPAVPLVFPLMEAPSGPMISVYVEDNSHHQKRNRRIVGVGVAAAACAATGGLVLIPALAGLAVNKVVKKKREKCVYAYGNTYIYELRAALARGLGVPPELLQLKRKGVFLDDLSRVCNYLEFAGKQRIHIAMHVKDRPVPGSVCQYEGQYEYPPVQFVDCSSYQFVLSAV